MRVASSDGVDVAVHELAGVSGPAHPLLLVAHATGFHGHAYLPMAAALAPRVHTVALDFRGHGDTPAPPGWDVDWTRYGDDALAAARAVAGDPGAARGLVGFGHSKGGASLVMAAQRAPGLFRLLVLYEPIVFPDDPSLLPDVDPSDRPIVVGARRRRATFPSLEDALANYAAKPPLNAFDPAALDAYVRYGFRADPAGGVRLKCDPEHEARTFEQGVMHATWDLLAEVDVPVVVVSGRVRPNEPSSIAAAVAGQLPRGRLVLDDELDHFGPMTHPRRVAALVASCMDVDGADPPPS